MTDAHGQRVGGIQRPAFAAHIEQTAHHEGHLFLFGPSCPHQRLFDEGRRVVADRHAAGGAGRHGRAPGLPQLEGAGGVLGGKDLLDGGLDGGMAADDRGKLRKDTGKPYGKGGIAARRGRTDDAAVHQRQDARRFPDDAPAGTLRSGVDADDGQGMAELLHAGNGALPAAQDKRPVREEKDREKAGPPPGRFVTKGWFRQERTAQAARATRHRYGKRRHCRGQEDGPP